MEFSAVPKHIGFIMDGNGRWAKLRGYPRVKGHRAGLKTVDNVLDLCKKYGVSYVSLYVFSTENWSRPKEEVDNLFNLAREYLKKSNGFRKRDIRVVVSGSMAELPADLAAAVADIERDTCGCASLTLNLCINYGGRDEIIHAVNRMVADGVTADEKPLKLTFTKNCLRLTLWRAQAERCGCQTLCCIRRLTPNFILPTCCGRISTKTNSAACLSVTPEEKENSEISNNRCETE